VEILNQNRVKKTEGEKGKKAMPPTFLRGGGGGGRRKEKGGREKRLFADVYPALAEKDKKCPKKGEKKKGKRGGGAPSCCPRVLGKKEKKVRKKKEKKGRRRLGLLTAPARGEKKKGEFKGPYQQKNKKRGAPQRSSGVRPRPWEKKKGGKGGNEPENCFFPLFSLLLPSPQRPPQGVERGREERKGKKSELPFLVEEGG